MVPATLVTVTVPAGSALTVMTPDMPLEPTSRGRRRPGR